MTPHPMTAGLAPSVIAVLALANEVRRYELAQAERHFANIGLAKCDCDDCAGKNKYPAAWYAIARRVLQNA